MCWWWDRDGADDVPCGDTMTSWWWWNVMVPVMACGGDVIATMAVARLTA